MARLVANAVPAIRLSRQLRGRPLAVMECVGNLLGCVEVGKGLNVSSVWDAVASAAGTQCFGLRNAECDAYDAIEGSRSRRLHPRPMGQAWWEDGGTTFHDFGARLFLDAIDSPFTRRLSERHVNNRIRPWVSRSRQCGPALSS